MIRCVMVLDDDDDDNDDADDDDDDDDDDGNDGVSFSCSTRWACGCGVDALSLCGGPEARLETIADNDHVEKLAKR